MSVGQESLELELPKVFRSHRQLSFMENLPIEDAKVALAKIILIFKLVRIRRENIKLLQSNEYSMAELGIEWLVIGILDQTLLSYIIVQELRDVIPYGLVPKFLVQLSDFRLVTCRDTLAAFDDGNHLFEIV